ncbi:hypothetical protein U5B43_04050 [Campylobacter sp. 9BO]|uniref:CPBP family glutamic-type intramembrane protease n=1 Tax=Campylobacter sp. 9BO TaxID=3424759 RepID=UPI003D351386
MTKLRYLNFTDILILSFIMFSLAIYDSTNFLLENFISGADVLVSDTIEMDDSGHLRIIAEELFTASLALLYLWYRRFDFSLWQFKISLKDTALAVAMFCICAILMDLFFYIYDVIYPFTQEQDAQENSSLVLQIKTLSILSSLVNGSFEELFFIAICLNVRRENLMRVFIFSLIIRISFHTYQGLYSAVGIGLILGLFYFFIYQKLGYKNLYAFFLSHAIADVFGLGLVNFFYFEFV